MGLKKQLSLSVVIANNNDDSEDAKDKIKEKIKQLPGGLLAVIKSVVMGESEGNIGGDGKRVK